MSREPRRPRTRRIGLIVAILFAAVAAAAAWAFLPWRHVDGLAVESARVMPPGEPDGSRKQAGLVTPRRIAVVFSTPRPVEAVRASYHAGFIAAKLFACDRPDLATREVVAQRAEYLADNGRVQQLPSTGEAARYRAVFDDSLSETVNHAFRRVPALSAGPLCFTLDGGSMGLGAIDAEIVPLPALR